MDFALISIDSAWFLMDVAVIRMVLPSISASPSRFHPVSTMQMVDLKHLLVSDAAAQLGEHKGLSKLA